jgi:DNA-binding NarL/FixJ family response regulator
MSVARVNSRCCKPLFNEKRWRWIADRLELSRRELQIVRLVFEDEQDRAIAGELGVSLNTLRTQFKRLYLKLGVSSRVGLVLQVLGEHLADQQEPTHIGTNALLHLGDRRAA